MVKAMAIKATIDLDLLIDSTSNSEEPYYVASFFVDGTYVEKEFIVGGHTIKVLYLQCLSTNYDLLEQLCRHLLSKKHCKTSLFATRKAFMEPRPVGSYKFILGYVSRFKSNNM
uniref:Uncharacterized protein n=1 Tax=Physcomitrium patens TaxID=3218 RepID=A0A2K1KJW1_PHYPA|nr:hypothetical protein PHYPA_007743 [Physcomitrium patens]